MKIKYKLPIIFLFFLFLLPQVSANRIQIIPSDYVYVKYLDEIAAIDNNGDLDVILGLDVFVSELLLEKYNNFTIKLTLTEPGYRGIESIKKIEICEWSKGGSTSRNINYLSPPYHIKTDCDSSVSFKKEISPFSEISLTIDLPKYRYWKEYYIKIKYDLPKFIKKKGDYNFAWFGTSCSPQGKNNCPDSKNINKYVILPSKDFLLEKIPTNADIHETIDEKSIVILKGYESQYISFTNAWWLKNRTVIWALLGAMIGAVISFFSLLLYEKLKYKAKIVKKENKEKKEEKMTKNQIGLINAEIEEKKFGLDNHWKIMNGFILGVLSIFFILLVQSRVKVTFNFILFVIIMIILLTFGFLLIYYSKIKPLEEDVEKLIKQKIELLKK